MLKRCMSNIFSKKDAEPLDKECTVLMMPYTKECTHCGKCVDICVTKAITLDDEWTIDLGKCMFCMECVDICPDKKINTVPAPDYSLRREDLIFSESREPSTDCEKFSKEIIAPFKGSVNIRELDAGSCNVCENEINCCSNPYYDMSRYGLKIVASPRHADVILVTGPMTVNMSTASKKTYDATPFPKLVIASGTCAISGGPFVGGDIMGGTDSVLKADMYITGCPPSPDRLIRSLLKAFNIIE